MLLTMFLFLPRRYQLQVPRALYSYQPPGIRFTRDTRAQPVALALHPSSGSGTNSLCELALTINEIFFSFLASLIVGVTLSPGLLAFRNGLQPAALWTVCGPVVGKRFLLPSGIISLVQLPLYVAWLGIGVPALKYAHYTKTVLQRPQ